ncbi:MAG: hypothetical protein GX262_05355 [Clostridia bacterium]|jgi:hypothetical protein|nr:hypothetical protein [Clostridia bacterium]
MYERWETLSPPLEKAFKKSVSVGELTIYQANLSGTTALALTNKAVYLLHRSWWKTKCVEVPLQDLAEIALESRDKIQLVTRDGRRHTLAVAQDSFPKGLKAVNRVLELVEKI